MALAQSLEPISSPATIRLIAPSRNGELIGLASIDGELIITDRGSFVRRWDMRRFADPSNSDHSVQGVVFFPGEESVLVAAGTALRILSVEEQIVEWEYRCPATLGFLLGRPQGATVRAGGAFAACFTDGSLCFWDADRNLVWRRSGDRVPRLLRFCSDGQELIGADGFEASLWSADGGKRLWSVAMDERIHGLEVDDRNGRYIVRTLRSIVRGRLSDGKVLDRREAGRGVPTLAVCQSTGRIAFGDEAGYVVVHPDGHETYCSVPSGVVSLAFSTDTPNVWVGTRQGDLRELTPECQKLTENRVYDEIRSQGADYSAHPSVQIPSEPMWPVSMAYGGIICGLGAAVLGLLGHSAISARADNIFDQNYGWSVTVLGLILGGLGGLVYGVLAGDRKL